MRLQEYLLQQILRFVRRANHPHDQTEKAPCVLSVQLLKGAGVPTPAPRRQLEVGGSHVSCLLRPPAGPSALPAANRRNGSCLTGPPKEGIAWQRSAGRQPKRKSGELRRRLRAWRRKLRAARPAGIASVRGAKSTRWRVTSAAAPPRPPARSAPPSR